MTYAQLIAVLARMLDASRELHELYDIAQRAGDDDLARAIRDAGVQVAACVGRVRASMRALSAAPPRLS